MLYAHPEICKPRRGIHYFNQNYDKGKEWYLKQIVKEHKKQIVNVKYGEFSTTYSYPECVFTVLKRIKSDFPHVKILINIRNPIERAKSDYLRSVKRNEVKNVGLLKACELNREFINRGFYANIIEAFQNEFGSVNIHVTKFEDIKYNSAKTIERIYSFLGVNNKFRAENLTEKRGSAYNPRIAVIEYYIQKYQSAGRAIERRYNINLFKKKSKTFINKIRKYNERKSDSDYKYKKYLLNVYREDIYKTQKLTGFNLSEWLSI